MEDDSKDGLKALDINQHLLSAVTNSKKHLDVTSIALGGLHAKLSSQFEFFNKINFNPVFNTSSLSGIMAMNDTYKNITDYAIPLKDIFGATTDILASQRRLMNTVKVNPVMEILSSVTPFTSIAADIYKLQNTIKTPSIGIQSITAVGTVYNQFEGLGAFNKNPLQDIMKGVTSLTSYYNTTTKIEHLYNPLSVLTGLPKYYDVLKNFQKIFPKGIVDFSKNEILKEAFNNINSSFIDALTGTHIKLDDDLSIADNLNIALNIDYRASGLTDSDLPVLIFERILTQINEIITDGKKWSVEKYKKLQAFFKTPLGAATLVVLGFYVNNAYGPKIAEWNNNLFGWEQTQPSHIPLMQCIATNNKILKLESTWDSETVGTISNSEILNIIEMSDDKKWIKVSFISQGTIIEGWTDNSDIETN